MLRELCGANLLNQIRQFFFGTMFSVCVTVSLAVLGVFLLCQTLEVTSMWVLWTSVGITTLAGVLGVLFPLQMFRPLFAPTTDD